MGIPSARQQQGATDDNDPVLSRSLLIGAEKRKAYIFDRLFEEKTLQQVYNKFRSLPYYLADHDRDDTQAVKHLVHVFESQEIQSSGVVRAIVAGVQELAQGEGIKAQQVAKVYANFNLHGDFQFVHDDGDVWTALVFVNASWHEDWGGELLLYDGTSSAPTESGFAYAISPRPGRMVIFDGKIKHRGGVPSKFCLEPRISLAIKFPK